MRACHSIGFPTYSHGVLIYSFRPRKLLYTTPQPTAPGFVPPDSLLDSTAVPMHTPFSLVHKPKRLPHRCSRLVGQLTKDRGGLTQDRGARYDLSSDAGIDLDNEARARNLYALSWRNGTLKYARALPRPASFGKTQPMPLPPLNHPTPE